MNLSSKIVISLIIETSSILRNHNYNYDKGGALNDGRL